MNKEKKISYLVLIRHGQSEWNEQNLFTGWKNPPLTEKGIKEAENAGEKIKSLQIIFSHYFTSALIRAQETGEIILNTLQQKDLIKVKDQNLNERDYGDLSGLNKDEARKEWGEDQVHIWRRSYDTPPPNGESLKDVVNRVSPYYEREILPYINDNKNVLIAAHGNSLRATMIQLGLYKPEQISSIELPTGSPFCIDFNNGILEKSYFLS